MEASRTVCGEATRRENRAVGRQGKSRHKTAFSSSVPKRMKHLLYQFACFFTGHDWYIVDYFFGIETKNTWNMKECARCFKAELD